MQGEHATTLLQKSMKIQFASVSFIAWPLLVGQPSFASNYFFFSDVQPLSAVWRKSAGQLVFATKKNCLNSLLKIGGHMFSRYFYNQEKTESRVNCWWAEHQVTRRSSVGLQPLIILLSIT